MRKIFQSVALLALVCVSAPAFADSQTYARQIDRIVSKELKRLDQEPREEIDDYAFCRRVYLDAIGRIPTLGELDRFIADDQPNKRARLIEELLHSKGYNSHWYNYWADLLRVKQVGDKLHHPGNFSEWIKESVRSNKPYDEMAYELINSSGKLYEPGNGATGFYAREPMALDHLSNSVKTFLGMSIECAQCHDDPYADWTQQDFYALAAFSSKTYLRVDPLPEEEKATYAENRAMLKQKDFDEWIVYRESVRVKHAAIHGNGTGYMRLPHDYQYDDGEPFDVVPAYTLFGDMPELDYTVTKEELEKAKHQNFGPGINSRQSLAEWMTSPDSPLFTKATVNRLWHQVMGTELVGPLGGLSEEEMGEHPELTEKLVEILKESDYDTKRFLSALFNSRIYQSKALALGVEPPTYVLDGPVVRRLPAEVIVDSFLSLKTDTPDKYVATEFKWDAFTHFYDKSQSMGVEDFVDYSIKGPGRKAFHVREEIEANTRNGDLGPKDLWRVSSYRHHDGNHEIAVLMGQSNRDLIDSANREPDIPQILYMMNGDLEDEIIDESTALIHRNLEGVKNRSKRMAIIWKSILGRTPKASEKKLFAHAEGDIIWALLNSNEFKFSK